MDVLTDTSIRQQPSDLESLSTMSTPALSDFSNTVSPFNDGKDGYISNGTVAPEPPVEMLPPLDSFVPIIEKLPGVVLDNNQYFVDGPLATAELEQFVSYTRRVAELVLSDTQLAGSPEIASETIARLALIQDPKSPMLPSLERLRLVNADRSLACLFFCISPSLKSLEIQHIPSNRQITISSFLKELVLGAPHISDITLRGRLPESALKTSLQFHNLRQLHLIEAAQTLDFVFLEEASALPKLEEFVIVFDSAQYQRRVSPPENTPLASTADDDTGGQTISVLEQPSRVPFPRLMRLNVTSSIDLIADLINYLPPRAVKDVSLTLVQQGLPQNPVEPHISSDTWVKGAAEDPEDSSTRLMHEMTTEELRWICDQSPTTKKRSSTKRFETMSGAELCLTPQQERQYRDHLAERLEHLKRQELLEVASLFAAAIENILSFGNLNSLSIDHSDMALAPPSRIEFPLTTFEKILSYPTLKELKLGHWAIPSLIHTLVDSAIAGPTLLMSLKSLRLPLDKDSGVSISTLHQIAQRYPRLAYLECFITLPSGSASQIDLESDIVPHELEVLSVVGELSTAEDKIAVATFLSLLFPRLKAIGTPKGPDAHWEYTYSLVKMCQMVRLAVEKQLYQVANPGAIA